MPSPVFVQMRQSGPKNTVTYEVIDKRRPHGERIVSTFKKEADAEAEAARLREAG